MKILRPCTQLTDSNVLIYFFPLGLIKSCASRCSSKERLANLAIFGFGEDPSLGN